MGGRRLVLFSFWILANGVGMTVLATDLIILFFAQLFIGIVYGINDPVLTGMNFYCVKDSEHNSSLGLHQSVSGSIDEDLGK